MSEFISICEEAARLGGAVLRDWEGRFQAREKAPADLVTEADLASQEVIHGVIARTFPDHAFVGEEGSAEKHSRADFCWVVDPLDGTTNYVRGIPHYCVSVALVSQGRLEVGAVFEPVTGYCYTAVRGSGAWKNGDPLRTTAVADLAQAVLAVSFPPRVRPDSREVADFLSVVGACQAVRRMGSTALNLCYLAEGRLDGYWSTSVHPWDVAAGVLLVQEAGGTVTGPGGESFDVWNARFVAAAGSELHEQLLTRLTP